LPIDPCEEALDVPGELDEVVESGVQQRVDPLEFKTEVAGVLLTPRPCPAF